MTMKRGTGKGESEGYDMEWRSVAGIEPATYKRAASVTIQLPRHSQNNKL